MIEDLGFVSAGGASTGIRGSADRCRGRGKLEMSHRPLQISDDEYQSSVIISGGAMNIKFHRTKVIRPNSRSFARRQSVNEVVEIV